MRRSFLKKAGIMILALIISFPLLLGLAGKARAEEYDSNRYKMITVHAGEDGYFDDDPTMHTVESLQFKGDSFNFDKKPVSETLVFRGWAGTPDATEEDVFPGSTRVNDLGTDVYAIWGNEITVSYSCLNEGTITVDGKEYSDYEMTVPVGGAFQAFPVTPVDDRVLFGGWHTGQSGSGTKYEDGQAVGSENLSVFPLWILDESKIQAAELDTDYDIMVIDAGEYYSFTPAESAVYVIRADIKDRQGITAPMIQQIDQNLKRISASTNDEDGNALLTVYMEEGQTYYFQVRENYGLDAEFVVRLEKADYRTVTFHANRGDTTEAYFDGDPELTEKEIYYAVGTNLKDMMGIGLMVDCGYIAHIGWALDPEDTDPLAGDDLTVTEDMDLYAIYNEFEYIILDANGGYFPTRDHQTAIYYNVSNDGNTFRTNDVPVIQDNTKKFLGWATTKDAETADIPEDEILAYQLRGMTLYAVYTEKMLVTLDANGGYFMIWPDLTIYTLVFPKGAPFAGVTASHPDTSLEPYSYVDQDGVEILYSDKPDKDYTIEKDSYLTIQWGHKLILNANGGFFPLLSGEQYYPVPQKLGGVFLTGRFEEETGGIYTYDYTKYFAGWATTPDAEEPDVIEGVTPADDLPYMVYAVWKDDSYYFVEGENGSWEKGGKDGFRVVIKRIGDDESTFSSFVSADPSGILVDGNVLEAESFTVEEGSLILTLLPSYLETLSVGDHTLAVRFKDVDPVTTTFTVKEAGSTLGGNSPETGDSNSFTLWIILGAVALVIIIVVIIILIKGKRK